VPRVVIVGAGFSGTATALHLLRLAAQRQRGDLDLTLLEREPRQFCRGVAYSTFDPRHILNVPAARMSFDPAAPDDFLDWLKGRGLAPREQPGEWFAPRQLYGQYLEARLREAESAAPVGVRFRRVTGEATDAQPLPLLPEGEAWTVTLRGGDLLECDALVLALGNFPPPHPVVADPQGYDSPRYFNRAWEPGAVDGIEPDDAVLLIGTGLTSIDMLVSLSRNGHRGPVTAVSRRGLWPFPHAHAPAWPDFLPADGAALQTKSVRGLFRTVRREIAKAAVAGVPWPSVINALRPRTVGLWRGLPRVEQKRFLRHARPWWEVARHRMPASSATLVSELTARGQLTTVRGRIRTIVDADHHLEVGVHERNAGDRVIKVTRVLNCTGAESNYRKLADPLVRHLMRHGLAHADALHLGLATDPDGRLEDAHGRVPHALYTLGPCRKGSLWETTAVPEIRGQAAALAARLLA